MLSQKYIYWLSARCSHIKVLENWQICTYKESVWHIQGETYHWIYGKQNERTDAHQNYSL